MLIVTLLILSIKAILIPHDETDSNCQEFSSENNSTCLKCKEGYGFKNTEGSDEKTCEPCSIEHCKDCYDNYVECKGCLPQYGISQSGSCTDCPSGCKECSSSVDYCTECEPEYGLVDYNTTQKCEPCPTGCKETIENNTKCISAKDG